MDLVNRLLVQMRRINIDAAPPLGLALLALQAGDDLIADHGGEVLEQRRRARRSLLAVELRVDAVARLFSDSLCFPTGGSEANIGKRADGLSFPVSWPIGISRSNCGIFGRWEV